MGDKILFDDSIPEVVSGESGSRSGSISGNSKLGNEYSKIVSFLRRNENELLEREENGDENDGKSSSLKRSSFSPYDLIDSLRESFSGAWKNTRQKHIDVSDDILAMYHETYLYGELSLTTRVRTMIRTGVLASVLSFIVFTAAAISSVHYIFSTYDESPASFEVRILLGVINIVFVVDYILKFYSSLIRIQYVFSWNGILDLITSLPCIFYFTGVFWDGSIFRIFMFIRVLRPLLSLNSQGIVKSSTSQEIIRLLVILLGIVSVAAGLLQWIDKLALSAEELEELGCSSLGCLNYFQAFYWAVVTISTVGYGDFIPTSTWGKLLIMLLIFVTIVLVPTQINKILEAVSRKPYGSAPYSRSSEGSNCVILAGRISRQIITDFLYTFFHPGHSKGMLAHPMRVVVFAPYGPSFEIKSLLGLYNEPVHYVEGSPLITADLRRASARNVSAVFIIANSHSTNPVQEDSAQFVQALAFNNYCNSKTRIIVEVADPFNANSALWDDTGDSIEPTCPDLIRFKLLAASVYLEGVTTFITNLFRPALKIANPMHDHFMFNYYLGHLQEIFPVLFPKALVGLRFQEVSEFLFLHLEVALFALDLEVNASEECQDQKEREVYLFPYDHVITSSDVGLIIAPNLESAEKVSKVGETKSFNLFNYGNEYEWYDLLEKVKEGWNDDGSKRSEDGEETQSSSVHSHSHTHVKQKKGIEVLDQKYLKKFMVGKVEKDLWDATMASSVAESPRTAISSFTHSPSSSFSSESVNVTRLQSLQEATEKLLSWPPQTLNEKPHPAIISKNVERILDNLKKRTLPIVLFNNENNSALENGHVLICINSKQWPHNLYHLISSLRSPGFEILPIVLLAQSEPPPEVWGCIGIFEQVYYIKGNPLYEVDLMRSQVLKAVKVLVLLSAGESHRDNENWNFDETFRDDDGETYQNRADIENLVVASNVERLRRSDEGLLVEFHRVQSFQFMKPKWLLQKKRLEKLIYEKNKNAIFQFCPPFQSGKAFCPYSLSFITYSSFHISNAWKIVDHMLSGGPAESAFSEKDSMVDSSLAERRLWQVPVPEEFDGKTFSELFCHFLHKKKLLALGLFRKKGTLSAVSSFVHTNPEKNTLLSLEDLVFVIV